MKLSLERTETEHQLPLWQKKAESAWSTLFSGENMTGWLTLPRDMQGQLPRIKDTAAKIRDESTALVVIGIGGSYLGARAAYEALPRSGCRLIFAGSDLSPNTFRKAERELENTDFSVAVISKSGTTTEPAIAFRLFRQLLEKKYGKGADSRIYAVTDPVKGALRKMAEDRGWPCFDIPASVGGRFSVLSPVGLLPMAAAGMDVDAVIRGALDAMEEYGAADMTNPVWQYAVSRNILYAAGKKLELFTAYEPAYASITEWLKQLFGESEGKENRGIYPASCVFTTDLHSLGQYIQQGERHLAQTCIYVHDTGADVTVPHREDDPDQLGYLEGKELSWIRSRAWLGTLDAHQAGGVPITVLELAKLDEYALGKLFQFFMLSCGLSGHLLGVNPFDQPGVEEYKKRMFALLGKQ